MKTFIVMLGILVLYPAEQSSAYPYLRTLVKEHGLTQLAASPMWIRYFPAGTETPPDFYDWLKQESGDVSKRDTKEALELLGKMRDEYLEKFYPPPSDEQVLEVLSNNAQLRALMTAFALQTKAAEMLVKTPEGAHLRFTTEQIFEGSAIVAILIMAIDAEDLDGKLLQKKLNAFIIKQNPFEIAYTTQKDRLRAAGDPGTPYEDSSIRPRGDLGLPYRDVGNFLARNTHVQHAPLSSDLLAGLQQRGYTDSKITRLFPPHVAQNLFEQKVLLENGMICGHNPAFAVDLLCEPGIIGDTFATVYQIEALQIDDFVAEEMGGIEVDSDKFTDMLKLLNDSENPASLLQIVELTRRGYSLAEIAALSYAARDSIIAIEGMERTSFASRYGKDVLKLNKIVEERGPLVFYLLQMGHVDNIEQVNQHRPLSHAEFANMLLEYNEWLQLIDGQPLVLVRQQAPEQVEQQ